MKIKLQHKQTKKIKYITKLDTYPIAVGETITFSNAGLERDDAWVVLAITMGNKKGPLLSCNRCNWEFTSTKEQVVDYHKGVARSTELELCPKCGQFDSHYIFEKQQPEQPVAIAPQQRQQLKSQLAQRTKIRRRKEDERRQHIYK